MKSQEETGKVEKNMSMKDNESQHETEVIEEGNIRKKRWSILDYHLEEIKTLRKLGLNAVAIHKIVKNKVPNGISYNGVLSYINRNHL